MISKIDLIQQAEHTLKKENYNESSYEKPSHHKLGYEEPSHHKLGYEEPSHHKPGYEEPSHHKPGYEEPSHHKPGHEKPKIHNKIFERFYFKEYLICILKIMNRKYVPTHTLLFLVYIYPNNLSIIQDVFFENTFSKYAV